MFGGLKEKLQAARNRLGSSIQGSAAAQAPPAAETKPGKPPQPAASQKTPSPAAPSFTDKVKILIVDRELVVSEKDIAEALSELEMTLLECDVALQVTDAIIASVRTNLIGKHRKIGSSIDDLVVGALKSALLDVLGTGFDVVHYIKTHPRPVKILFTGVNGTGKTTTIAKIGFFLKNHDPANANALAWPVSFRSVARTRQLSRPMTILSPWILPRASTGCIGTVSSVNTRPISAGLYRKERVMLQIFGVLSGARRDGSRPPVVKARFATFLVLVSWLSAYPRLASPEVPVPPGLGPGDTYHLVFNSSTFRNAASANIGDYDAFVQSVADAAGIGNSEGVTWRAIASTASVDAHDHAVVDADTPVFNMHMQQVASGFDDLWDGNLSSNLAYDELGRSNGGDAWTGSNTNGTRANGLTLGSNEAWCGTPTSVGTQWISNITPPTSDFLHVYAVSQELSVPGIAINAGFNDAWYFPDTAGQGFYLATNQRVGSSNLSGRATSQEATQRVAFSLRPVPERFER